jgi:hypothetical protein
VTLTPEFLDPKVNSGHLFVIYNHHSKIEIPYLKRSLVVDANPFVPTRLMCLLTPKSIGLSSGNVQLSYQV